MMLCNLCGGTYGSASPAGNHYLCEAKAKRGMPTECLGMACASCDGSGFTHRGNGVGVMLDFRVGPAAITRSIAATFPPCKACNGKGTT